MFWVQHLFGEKQSAEEENRRSREESLFGAGWLNFL